jgi:hypothetical protein
MKSPPPFQHGKLHSKGCSSFEEKGSQRELRNSNDDMNDVGHDVDSKDWEQFIVEVSRFANRLASCNALPIMWREAMDQDKVRDQL